MKIRLMVLYQIHNNNYYYYKHRQAIISSKGQNTEKKTINTYKITFFTWKTFKGFPFPFPSLICLTRPPKTKKLPFWYKKR